MSYLNQAALKGDIDIGLRVSACLASEGQLNPDLWFAEHAWQLSAQPGWVSAYTAAIAGGVSRPGASETVITDAMILTAVREINTLAASQDNGTIA